MRSRFFNGICSVCSAIAFIAIARTGIARADTERPLQVITYNAGLAKGWGVEVVPCVDERVQPQLAELDRILKAPFVLQLQEIWMSPAKDQYKAWAENRGYFIAAVWEDGQELMTVSSEPFVSQRRVEFKRNGSHNWVWDDHFGYLETEICYGGTTLRFFNAHTDYSPIEENSPIHESQLAELAALTWAADSQPRIMTGDFNIGPDLVYPGRTNQPATALWYDSFWSKLNHAWAWAGVGWIGPTWDPKRNPLVSNPSWVLGPLGDLDEHGGWGYSDFTMDHIFASPQLKEISTRLVLNHAVYVPDCEDRYFEGTETTMLSDHYGVESLFRVK